MGHTTPPLRVGYDGVKGYKGPDRFEIDHHERIVKYLMFFESNRAFRFREHFKAGRHYWNPKIQDGTDVGEYRKLPSLQTKNNRASKVGSGRGKK